MIKSPCINVCKLNDDVCTGCYRTAYEIEWWAFMLDDDQRTVILDALTREAQANGEYDVS